MFRRVVWAGAAAVIVLVGYAVYQAVPTPEKVVAAYFQALADRDVDEVMRHLDGSEPLTTYSGQTQSRMVLGDPRYQPPQDARVGGWQHAELDGRRLVAVQYELGGTTYSSLLRLLRQDGTWRISNGVGTVEVNYAGTAVNGQKVGIGKSMRLFPGGYELAGDPAAPIVTVTPMNVVVTVGDVVKAELKTFFGEAGRQRVKQMATGTIEQCARTGAAVPPGCPFKSTVASVPKLEWSIVSLPELVLNELEPGVVEVRGAAPGTVKVTTTDSAGVRTERVESFALNGKCVEIDGRVSCTFTA